MPDVYADRVLETSTTTGTGAYTLAGGVAGFITFGNAPAMVNGSTCPYYAEDVDANGNALGGYEIGTGTWNTGGTLTRTSIQASSNGGAAVSWAAGTRRIGLSLTAAAFAAKQATLVSGTNIKTVNGLSLLGTGDLAIAGGGGSTTEFVASGTIAGAGVAVAINSNGTVSAVSGVQNGASGPVEFENGTVQYVSATFDSAAGKVVIVYRDNSDAGKLTAAVGTVSGTTISFGAPVMIAAANVLYTAATYDSASGKVVIAYKDQVNAGYGTAIVGTVTGTSISFGTPVVFEAAETSYIGITYHSAAGKVVIAYQDVGNFGYGTAIVGTVSGTTISFGATAIFRSNTASYVTPVYDSAAGKIVIVFQDVNSSQYGTAIVGTVSGTSISFGTHVVFRAAGCTQITATYDSIAGKVVIAYQDYGNSYYGTAIVGTVSGTTISFGTSVVFQSATVESVTATFDVAAGKVVFAYRNYGNSSYGTAIVGTVSGTSISFEPSVVFLSANGSFYSLVYDNNAGKSVISFSDASYFGIGRARVWTTASSNNKRLIGVAQSAANDAATLAVKLPYQIDTNQTGLIPGTVYYLTGAGVLTTSATDNMKLGTALSATSILITNWGR